jgi:EAL domain-containing protein (putative c-di-GMP-specific phosphodiesterase class I)
LLRWHRAGNGWVAPAEFIPVAEQSGLIEPIGRWVLEHAVQTAARWRSSVDTGPPFVSVNLSARQLADAELLTSVRRVLRQSRLAPHRLVLEITESVLLEDSAETIERLRALKGLGISLAIDDFGTGFSSLSYLRRLPIDKIKIDQSFVADLHLASGAALVGGIVALGHSLGLEVVAEGVEREAQAEALTRQGCELAQGFHFGRPVPLDELLVLLAQPTPPAAVAGTRLNRADIGDPGPALLTASQ